MLNKKCQSLFCFKTILFCSAVSIDFTKKYKKPPDMLQPGGLYNLFNWKV